MKRFVISSLAAAGIAVDPALSEEPLIGDSVTVPKGEISLFDSIKKTHSFTLAAHRSHASHGSHQSHRSSTPRPPTPDARRTSTTRVQPQPAPKVTVAPAPVRLLPQTSEPRSTSTPDKRDLPSIEIESPSDSSQSIDSVQPLLRQPRSVLNSSQSSPPVSILPEISERSIKPKTLPGNSNRFREIARKLQAGLSIYGYYSDAIDGLIGPKTRMAISQFQNDYGLQITGTITADVLDSLGIVAE